jgi:ketosteroid isomerase-like protein
MDHTTRGKSDVRIVTLLIILSLWVWLIYASPLAAQEPSPAVGSTDSIFRELIMKRLQAFDKGDAAEYQNLIADDFVHVDDAGTRRSGRQILQYVSSHVAAGVRREIGELYSRRFGDLALVDAEVIEYTSLGPRELRTAEHETDVFILREGRWLFLQHAETRTLALPKPAAPDKPSLDSFAGRYEWWPGYSEVVSRREDNLYVSADGDTTPTLMHPATSESYFIDDASLIVFVRNASGEVTHQLVHFPDGQVIVARKVVH